MLNILRIDHTTPIVLRQDLGIEDLACLLDLLRGASTLELKPLDLSIGYELPPQTPAKPTMYPKMTE